MAKKIVAKEPVVEPVVEIPSIKQIKVKKIKKLGVEIPSVIIEVVKEIELSAKNGRPKRIMSEATKLALKKMGEFLHKKQETNSS